MKITPVEITNKDFKRTMRGYSTDEVDEFLDDIAEDFEALYRENATLKEKIESFSDKIEYYSSLEKTLQNTLILAQNTAEATKKQAESEAEHIIENAKVKANSIIETVNGENERLLREYERSRMEFSNFKMRVLGFMENQMGSFSVSSQEIERGTLGTSSLQISGIHEMEFDFPPLEEDGIENDATIRG